MAVCCQAFYIAVDGPHKALLHVLTTMDVDAVGPHYAFLRVVFLAAANVYNNDITIFLVSEHEKTLKGKNTRHQSQSHLDTRTLLSGQLGQ